MSEPRTEAGKRLFDDLTDLDATLAAPTGDYLGPNGALRAILAIEAEAAAPSLTVERLATLLAGHSDKAGHVLPPLINEDGQYRLATPQEFAAAILAALTPSPEEPA